MVRTPCHFIEVGAEAAVVCQELCKDIFLPDGLGLYVEY